MKPVQTLAFICVTTIPFISSPCYAWLFKDTPTSMLDRGISCVSKITKSQKGGKAGLNLSILTLNNLMSAMPDTKEMKKAVVECEEKSGTLSKSPKVSQEIYKGMLNFQQFDKYPGITKLLSGFVEPKMYCSESGLTVGAGALAIGAGFSGNISSCRDSFGVRWVAAGIGPQFQSKWFGVSFFTHHDDNHVHEYKKSPVYITKNSQREFSNGVLTTGWPAMVAKAAAITAVSFVANSYFPFIQKGIDASIGKTKTYGGYKNMLGGSADFLANLGGSAMAGALIASILDLRSTNIHGKGDKLLGQGFSLSVGGMSSNSGRMLNVPFMPRTTDKSYLRNILLGAKQKTVEVDLYQ